jgi:hypothetical protein
MKPLGMKNQNERLFLKTGLTRIRLKIIAPFLLFLALGSVEARSSSRFIPDPDVGPGDLVVRGKDGGLIFGFEIDPNSTEGLLCEAIPNSDGTVSAKVETFSQSTGKIIRVLSKSESQDDFIALDVAPGQSA